MQRYEGTLGLPVRRPAGKSAGSVMATKADLDDWVLRSARHLAFAPTVQAIFHKTDRVRADFLRVDSEILL